MLAVNFGTILHGYGHPPMLAVNFGTDLFITTNNSSRSLKTSDATRRALLREKFMARFSKNAMMASDNFELSLVACTTEASEISEINDTTEAIEATKGRELSNIFGNLFCFANCGEFHQNSARKTIHYITFR